MFAPDFSVKKQLLLTYPQGFYDYDLLTPFFDNLISKIPLQIELNIIVGTKSVGSLLRDRYIDRDINLIPMEGFEEIWLRDLMGFPVNDYIVKPIFRPNYCGTTYDRRYIDLINKKSIRILTEYLDKKVIELPLVWDGGNLVSNGKIGFITDKIYFDNPSKKQVEIKSIINEYLGIEPIIIQNNSHDNMGHLDGYMAFYDEDTVFLSQYPRLGFLKEDKTFIYSLESKLKERGLKVEYIYDRPVYEKVNCNCTSKIDSSKYCFSARGVYVNFLRLNESVVLPQYTIPKRKGNPNYNKMNIETVSKYFDEVIPINCNQLSRLAGVLHCISFAL